MQESIFGRQNYLNKSQLIEAVRLDIIGELEAINQYSRHANMTDNALAKAVWTDIRDEERVHVGELLTLLNALDPGELEKLKEGQEEVEAIMRELGM